MTMQFVVSIAGAVLLGGLLAMAQIRDVRTGDVPNFRPVTEEMLRNPPPEDWLNWRRTDNGWGYSPLNQITAQNVHQLQLAWAWAMDDRGSNQATPLIHDGIMYLPNTGGIIQALDAATGELIWEYRPGVETVPPRDPNIPSQGTTPRQTRAPEGTGAAGVQRNIAIFGDKIFGGTSDAHIVAINARTGRLEWDVQTADPKLGYEYSSGPIVVRGTVIAGMSGCNRYKHDVCYLIGLDANTGKEKWRTSSIARPGEPGGDTWGDLPLEFRAGGDMWMPGTYDPETNTVFWGTAQAKPWARAARGTDGDALYTASTLAVDPDTGKMKWYYQHIPGETHDMDEAFERILVDLDGRKSLFTMGKIGILWQLDRVTGTFIASHDLGYQNMLRVEQTTGRVIFRPNMIPRVGVQFDMCPSTAGLKSWRAMAYSPQTSAVYIPINLQCEHATFGPVPRVLGGGGNGPVKRVNYMHPEADGNLGEFRAMDVRTGRTLWRQRYSSPMNTSALATAGGVAFAGDWDRYMYAYDAATGKVLWQTRLATTAQGSPVTYSVRGKQYLAISSGTGGGSWSSLIAPDLRPDIRRPFGGNAVFVFALPDPQRGGTSAP